MLVTSCLPCGLSHLQAHRSVLPTPRQRDTLIAAHGEGWWVEDCIDAREESTRPRRAAAVAMSATAVTAATAATAATSIAEAVEAPWHEVRLGPASAESAAASLGEQIECGDVVLCLPEAATPAECVQLTAEASAAAEALRQARFETGLDPEGRARLPTLAAAARATAAGTPCAAPLSPEADAICCRVLRRMLRRIDAELPSLGTQLFGGAALGELLEADLLDFSSREPAVNVYGEGGARPIRPGGIGPGGRGRGCSGAVLTPCHATHVPGDFLAHKDHQRLTLLVALSEPHDFAGGGGAACSQALPLTAPPAGSARARPHTWPPQGEPAGEPAGLRQLDTPVGERDCPGAHSACAQPLNPCARAASEAADSTALDHPRHRLLGARLARPSRRGSGDRAATSRRHRAALRRPRDSRGHAGDRGRTRGLRRLVQPARRHGGAGGGGRAEPRYLWRSAVAREGRRPVCVASSTLHTHSHLVYNDVHAVQAFDTWCVYSRNSPCVASEL